MSVFPLYVPTRGRAGASATLAQVSAEPLLASVTTLVVEEWDAGSYQAAYPDLRLLVLPQRDQGIGYARQAVLVDARLRGLEWAWMVDDDITKFARTVNKRNIVVPMSEALTGAQAIFSACPEVGLAALEFQQFAWCATRPAVRNSYCNAVVCVNLPRTLLLSYRAEFRLKEDLDFALQVLTSGYDTLRVQAFSFYTPALGSNGGGCQELYRANGKMRETSERLIEIWGGDIVQHYRKSNGRDDVKIDWKKAAGR